MEESTVVIFPDFIDASMSPKTLRRGFLVLGVITAIIIIALLIFGFIYSKSYFYVDIETTPDSGSAPLPFKRTQISPHQNTGSSTKGVIFNQMNGTGLQNPSECNADPRRVWMNGRCVCRPPFWGERCERESHSNKYYAIGNYEVNGKVVKVDAKAFPSSVKTCEQECNSMKGCIGYSYENGNCTLMTSSPIHTHETYNPYADNTTYLLQGERPLFPNKVFLYQNLPMRFWISSPEAQVAELNPNRVTKMNWTPSGIINDGGYTLIFSSKSFTADEGRKNIYRKKEGWYVYHHNGSTFAPPHSIVARGVPYWVMVLRDEEEKTPTDMSLY